MEKLLEKRAGGLILRIEKDEELEYLVVKSVAGQFELRLRDDTMNFHMIKGAMEENQEDFYGFISHMWFMMGVTLPDAEYFDAIMAALKAREERYLAEYPEGEEEDEEKVIADMEMAAKIEEELAESAGTENPEA